MAFFFSKKNEIPKDKQIQDLELSKIIPNRYQPRHEFSTASIEQLAQTLDSEGLLQPIVVREKGENFEIIAGERRFRAAKSLNWKTIPAIVQNMDDQKAASLALIENLQRENLNPIDEAHAYEDLMELNDLTQTALAKDMGKSQSYIANKLRLLKLNPEVQSYLVSGNLTARHGRAMLGLSSDLQTKVLHEILKNKLSVKETEAIVADPEAYFAAKEQPKAKEKEKKKVVHKTSGDLKVQINTIKQAIKLAKDSGIEVKVHEENSEKEYKVTIELKRK
ncbi:nucleoid occlusion protein [Lactobacillus psittaci]|uniref:Chromosome partitioning protein n=1 Tax=Lactobacillus psittaci DSM 15354 TaxID=1122152 RepID=A0A0R1S3X0_9LACO|nr:nucleoid occlusion protein [Lactobacillus psittaci]KRL63337.1 chromosome partitioning protein [Lactobacillus psittaci DSM 15354]